jgi:hypothetical protein
MRPSTCYARTRHVLPTAIRDSRSHFALVYTTATCVTNASENFGEKRPSNVARVTERMTNALWLARCFSCQRSSRFVNYSTDSTGAGVETHPTGNAAHLIFSGKRQAHHLHNEKRMDMRQMCSPLICGFMHNKNGHKENRVRAGRLRDDTPHERPMNEFRRPLI